MTDPIDPSIYRFIDSMPFLNGTHLAGLGVHDNNLPSNKKLRIFEDESEIKKRALKSACWAYKEMPEMKSDYAIGAYACVAYNLIARDDGDSISEESTDSKDSLTETVEGFLTEANLKKALILIFSTKINFWQEGSHSGESSLSGYNSSVAKAIYDLNSENKNELKELFNTVGHWASTIKILKMLNVRDLKEVHDYEKIGDGVLDLNAKNYILISPNIFPAGTSRHAHAYEICKLLASHPLVRFVPNIASFSYLAETVQDIKKYPALFHEKAHYLTGKYRVNFNDYNAKDYLGRLAPFVFYCFPEHPRAKSRYVSECVDGRRVLICQNYDDFDFRWETLCKRYNQTRQLPQTTGNLESECKDEIKAKRQKTSSPYDEFIHLFSRI